MSEEEFLWKLRQVLIAMSEIWYEPQWYFLNDELIAQQYGYVSLDEAQVSFARAESLLNPSQELEHVGTRIEKWKQQLYSQKK
jgi:hypothetical protein